MYLTRRKFKAVKTGIEGDRSQGRCSSHVRICLVETHEPDVIGPYFDYLQPKTECIAQLLGLSGNNFNAKLEFSDFP